MSQKRADLLIASISMAWGSSYLLMKLGLNNISPLNLITLRFSIAFAVTVLLFWQRVRMVNKETLSCSMLLGGILCVIFVTLLYGLDKTSASSAGFLVSTSVVFIPVIQAVITRKLPKRNIVMAVIIISVGLAFMTISDDFEVDAASLLCLLCALLYAAHVIVTDKFVSKVDALQLGVFQLGFAALFGFILTLILDVPTIPHTAGDWGAVLGLALLCSAYCMVVQPIAQKYTTPENVGILLTLEPVFSAIFAFLFLHEVMSLKEYLGTGMILCGIFVANYKTSEPDINYEQTFQKPHEST